MGEGLGFRWWGNAGIELRAQGQILLIDPLATRPSMMQLWRRQIASDQESLEHHLEGCDFILATCARWDHFMDIPQIARMTGAQTFGAEDACQAMRDQGIPPQQVQCVGVGDRLDLGPFGVQVLAADHGGTLMVDWLERRARLNAASSEDASADMPCYGFHIRAAGLRLLVPGQELLPADVLFVSPAQDEGQIHFWLAAVRPEWVIPIHWDNIFRPLSQPPQPYLESLRLGWPPIQRIDLDKFTRLVQDILPDTRVLVPERFRSYELSSPS